jgi:preprotein translocase subunit SecE
MKSIKRALIFLKEVYWEVMPRSGRVSWPDRKTVIGSTAVVFVTVALVSLYLGLIDALLSRIIRLVVQR